MFSLLLFSIHCTWSSQASTRGTWALQHCCQDLTGCFWRITQEYGKWKWHLQCRDRTVWHDTFYFARLALVPMYWARGQGKPLSFEFYEEKRRGRMKIFTWWFDGAWNNFIQPQWKRNIVIWKNSLVSKRSRSRMVLFAVSVREFIYWLGLSRAITLN